MRIVEKPRLGAGSFRAVLSCLAAMLALGAGAPARAQTACDAAKAQLARAKEFKNLSDEDKLFLKEADQLLSAKEPKSRDSREKDAAKP